MGPKKFYYIAAFIFTIPIFVLCFYWQMLQSAYAIIYFFATTALIIGFTGPEEDPQHSTITHYQVLSRYNRYTYTIAGYIMLSALLYILVPIQLKHFTVFAMWIIGIMITRWVDIRVSERLWINLLEDYLYLQLPNTPVHTINEAILALVEIPEISPQQLSERLEISLADAEAILQLVDHYIDHNL